MSPIDPPEKAMMPFTDRKRRSMGITLRITLLAWLVAMATLIIFVLVTIPLQKSIYLKNLKSKANSVAVSLHEAVAGAAINEDFASVVDAGQAMIKGDPDLEFLIVMKNDGYAIAMQPNGWRVYTKSDPYWLDRERKPTGVIKTVPLFNRRVYHFAQPFNYSGIRWGWIHVGLSLKGYDRGVAMIYRHTVYLAVGCMFFSLLVSWVYARQMVRPILRLRSIVQQIAGGDLSVRADRLRQDELGTLAASVNKMTEALLRRDSILGSVRYSAQQFMRSSRWESAIDSVLAEIGQAAAVDGAYLFESQEDDDGERYVYLRREWVADGACPRLSRSNLKKVSHTDARFARWAELFRNNEIIAGPAATMPAGERALLETQGMRSIIAIPVFVENTWWGYMGLADCHQDRVWTDAEKDSLRAAGDMLGATIARQRIQDALIDAKATLEQRVQERTQELQTQVGAKERALSELADAQSSLLEVSRAAGMAEVATGVLHNVGNVLNSVNVSCTLLMDRLRESRVANLAKVADLMAEHDGGLVRFLSEDPRGQQIPVYLSALAGSLRDEQQEMIKEAETLNNLIAHIKEIVSMQQSYGRVSGVKETIPPEQLMEDALKLNSGALARHGITVQRQYEPVPPITVDKHTVLQILLNLIHNAKYACTDIAGTEKIIVLKLLNHQPGRIKMQVADNGIGIHPENMTRIFQHGFTTRRTGHGFGLHSGALAARELHGSLTAHSDGPGLGATFTLELPCRSGERV